METEMYHLNPLMQNADHLYIAEVRAVAEVACPAHRNGEWVSVKIAARNRTQAAAVAKWAGYEVGSMSMEG